MSKIANTNDLPSARSVGFVLLIAAVMLWIIWVSLRLTQPNEQKIVQVRMSEIMRDFVDAEAKGNDAGKYRPLSPSNRSGGG